MAIRGKKLLQGDRERLLARAVPTESIQLELKSELLEFPWKFLLLLAHPQTTEKCELFVNIIISIEISIEIYYNGIVRKKIF